MKIKKFPIVLAIFRDTTIDIEGADRVIVGFMWIRKGRTLTITGHDERKRFEMMMQAWSILKGDIRFARKPKEMTVEEMRRQIGPFATPEKVETTSQEKNES